MTTTLTDVPRGPASSAPPSGFPLGSVSIPALGLSLGLFFAITFALLVWFGAIFGQGMFEGMEMGDGVNMSEHMTQMAGGLGFWPFFLIGLVVSFALGWYIALIFGPLYNWAVRAFG
jgi:hypothetical protein